jgi:hypothetical protein
MFEKWLRKNYVRPKKEWEAKKKEMYQQGKLDGAGSK